jgi:dodecin
LTLFQEKEVISMAEPRVARVTEIIAGSPKGFEEAIKVGFARATKTLRGITGMRVVEMRVAVENSKIIEYRIRLEIIFVLET